MVPDFDRSPLGPQTAEEQRLVDENGTLDLGYVTYSIEGDLVRVYSDPGLRPADYDRLLRLCEAVVARRGRFFLMAVGGPNTPPMGPEQRKRIAQWSRQFPPRAVAIVSPGSSFIRAMTTLLLRAINLMSGRNIPLAFFAQEADARKWLQGLQRVPSVSSPALRSSSTPSGGVG